MILISFFDWFENRGKSSGKIVFQKHSAKKTGGVLKNLFKSSQQAPPKIGASAKQAQFKKLTAAAKWFPSNFST